MLVGLAKLHPLLPPFPLRRRWYLPSPSPPAICGTCLRRPPRRRWYVPPPRSSGASWARAARAEPPRDRCAAAAIFVGGSRRRGAGEGRGRASRDLRPVRSRRRGLAPRAGGGAGGRRERPHCLRGTGRAGPDSPSQPPFGQQTPN